MRRWLLVSILLFVGGLALLGWLVAAPSADEDPAVADANRLYCLAPQRQAELITAAATLGLARQGSASGTLVPSGTAAEMTPGRWSSEHGPDFDRACAALAGRVRIESGNGGPSSSGGQSSAGLLLTTFTNVFPVLVGSVIGYGFGELRARAANANERGRMLEDAAAAFDRSARALLEAWSAAPLREPPDDWPMQERLTDLEMMLRRYAIERPGWPFISTLQEEVREFGALLRADDWRRSSDTARRAKAEELFPRLERLSKGLTQLAAAVERPRRQRSAMTATELGAFDRPSRPQGDHP